jgi:class 3 adenylate cyclase/tetratricopeptide (TPR) repeat protein
VTVLFGDVVGFTALAEHLDPEQVKRLIDRAFQRLVDDVTSFGGRVDKLMGDGILALFGAPVAHEDDAERAVRAGLRMQQSMARFAQQSSLDQPLQMRIGINTGEVLVGTLAGTDYTAMGDVVNTASRLQSEAPPGGVLVGEATFALTSGVIEYGPLNELQPRGREHSISTWLAVDTLAPPGSRQRRSDLRLVGRDAELGLARSALHLALAERRSLMLNVLGESGVGKTRLIDELLATLDELGHGDVHVLEGVCVPYGESNVWAPIASALTTHLGLDPSLSADEVRERAVAKATRLMADDVAPHPEIERAAEVFLHLLGYESALDGLDVTARRDVVQRTVARVVELRAETLPLVLWIDDLHWADQVVVDVLEHLAASVTRVPFVLLTSMRPGSEVVWPPTNDRTTIVSLTVQPLDRADSDELASELLGEMSGERVVDPVANRSLLGALFDRSGGNPLFLQQLAQVVADQGPSSELPDSLRALIAARLDQLPTLERQVLDNAATLGLTGNMKSLEQFAEKMRQPFDRNIVAQLDAKGFLELDGQRWKFRSDSVRETTYQTLTKASRAERHAGVAAAIAAHSPTGLDDLAHHTATAAELVADLGPIDHVPRGIRADAIRYLTAAAERARDTGSQRMLVRHTSRALALLEGHPEDAERHIRLALLRCSGLIELRNFREARLSIDAVLAEAIERGDVESEGAARRLLGMLYHLLGDQANARIELGMGVELLRTTDAVALLADALRQRGFIELFGGSLVDAEWFFGEAEAEYLRLADERGLAYIEQHRAWLSFLSGDLTLADERLHSAADTLNRLGDRNGVGWAYGLLAFVRFFQRRFIEAEDLANVVGAEALDRGDDWAAAMMQTLLADLRLWQGNLNEALANGEQARNRFKRIGDKFGLVQSLAALVRIQVALGRESALQRSTEELLTLADNSPWGPLPVLAVAGAAMHRGDGQMALAMVERGLDRESANAGNFEALVVRTIAYVQLGLIDDALTALDQIGVDSMEHPFAQVAVALVRSLSGDADAAVAASDSVMATVGATYLDRAIAAVAAAGAHSALGDRVAAQAVLDQALTECLAIGDVVAIALLQRTHRHVLGTEHESGAGTDTWLGDGWVTVVSALPALQHAG